jgi:hypothetical protein
MEQATDSTVTAGAILPVAATGLPIAATAPSYNASMNPSVDLTGEPARATAVRVKKEISAEQRAAESKKRAAHRNAERARKAEAEKAIAEAAAAEQFWEMQCRANAELLASQAAAHAVMMMKEEAITQYQLANGVAIEATHSAASSVSSRPPMRPSPPVIDVDLNRTPHSSDGLPELNKRPRVVPAGQMPDGRNLFDEMPDPTPTMEVCPQSLTGRAAYGLALYDK